MLVIGFFAAIREILAKTAKAKFNVYQASKFSAANQQNCHQLKLAKFKTRKFNGKSQPHTPASSARALLSARYPRPRVQSRKYRYFQANSLCYRHLLPRKLRVVRASAR